jgi:hypothetical protein
MPTFQKVTDKCFTKCVARPGAKLDDSEKICLAKCMDRCVLARGIASPHGCCLMWYSMGDLVVGPGVRKAFPMAPSCTIQPIGLHN